MGWLIAAVFLLVIAIVALFVRRNLDEYDKPWASRVSGIAFPLFVVAFLFSMFTSVPAGHVGVMHMFGSVYNEPLQPGLHLINPLASVDLMSVQTQEIKEVAQVPSKEGLSVKVEFSILFHLSDPVNVYKKVGRKYVSTIVEPQGRSVFRGVTAEYEARSLYTVDRTVIEQKVYEHLAKLLEGRGVTLEVVLFRDVSLPEQVRQAIDSKAAAEQDAERMKFVLLKEKQEAERKKIEAGGIADFQRIVTQGITPSLLKWKGIEATEALAKSSNSKVVVIGSGPGGLPLILGSDK